MNILCDKCCISVILCYYSFMNLQLKRLKMNKSKQRVLRLIEKMGITMYAHQDSIFNNLVEAADILTNKELEQMIRDYGF